MSELNIVTGAFSYHGKYIAKHLLEIGENVVTLTNHPDRENPFNNRIKSYPFNFENPEELENSLKGAAYLYNTYWVRFPYKGITFEQAIKNTFTLFEAAKKAGVKKIVHLSVSNPAVSSPLPYYSGKAVIEKALIESGMSYSIIRPTVVYGHEDILINNIAYMLRKFPLFTIPSNGEYKLQPIFVEDVAQIAINAARSSENSIIDAAGPDIFTYNELINIIKKAIGSKSIVFHLPTDSVVFLTKFLNILFKDIVLTRNEIKGLMTNLLVSSKEPLGKVSFTKWLNDNSDKIGRTYISDIKKHF